MRILSLLPSATEIVCALGAGDELVGRSAECDYPASVSRLPIVMRARTLDSDLPSAAIDARVQHSRGRGESLYELDIPSMRALRPEVILTQDLCGVCSVTDDEVRSACRVAGVAPRIVSLAPRTLDDVWQSVEAAGAAIGRKRQAEQLADDLRERTTPAGGPDSQRPTVAVLEWLDPPILAGLWTPQMIERSGGASLGPPPGQVGRRLRWADLAAQSPDWTILAPCSFSVRRTREELAGRPPSSDARRFFQRTRVVLADEAYFSRPGPRLADGVELLARLVRGQPAAGPMPVEPWAPETLTPVAP